MTKRKSAKVLALAREILDLKIPIGDWIDEADNPALMDMTAVCPACIERKRWESGFHQIDHILGITIAIAIAKPHNWTKEQIASWLEKSA